MTHRLCAGMRVLFLAISLVPALAHAQVPVEQRIALVVGNWSYAQAPLKNPENDLADVARLLEGRLRFDHVIVEPNADSRRLKTAIRTFGERLERAAAGAPGRVLALFYYSGHGVQSEGKNYLLPVGRSFESEDDVESDAVEVQFVLDRMRRAGGGLNVVILDACRDFPLRRRAKSETRGLARIQPPQGSLVAYATEPDATAYDNPGERNGLFTKHLLQRLAQANLDVDRALDHVSTDVAREAERRGRRQIPEITKKTWPPEPVYLIASGSAMPLSPRDEQPPGKIFRAGDIFRDCPECPEMVVIPAGEFQMGSPIAEGNRLPDAIRETDVMRQLTRQDEGLHSSTAFWKDEGLPQHAVTIGRPFAASRFEVTFAEWDACVAAGGCGHEPADEGWGRGRRPVINVSWHDAHSYIAWLSKKTGKGYRLLTEAEWEYAARAGSHTLYPWGDEFGTSAANLLGSQGPSSGPRTALVGSFPANRFGLHDMIGNVSEWVQDCYQHGYRGAPTNGSARDCREGTLQLAPSRVLRGGSFADAPWRWGSSGRGKDMQSRRFERYGFRVARTLP